MFWRKKCYFWKLRFLLIVLIKKYYLLVIIVIQSIVNTSFFHRANVTTYERSHVKKTAFSAYLHTYMETIILPQWNYIVPFLKHNFIFITERITSTYPLSLFAFLGFSCRLTLTRKYDWLSFHSPPKGERASVYWPCKRQSITNLMVI